MATVRVQNRSRSSPSSRWAARVALVATAALGLAGFTVPASSAAAGPSFKVFDTSVAETSSDSIATVKIQLSYRPTVRATVDWRTVDDTATAGEDYVARSGTASFPRGVRTKYVKVKVLPDTLDEGDEGFGIQLSDAWPAQIGHSYGYVTIVDDDEEPSLSTEDVQVTEGDAGATDVELPVWLSEESGRTVTVGYAVTPGTATHDKDYSISSTTGTLVFLPGQTEESVTVSVLGDKDDELDETVNFSLVQPVNAWLDEGEAVLTIVDDDSPGISVDDVSATEGGNAVFTVSLSAASPQQVTVDYATKDGTASSKTDYTAKSGTLTFAPGEKTKQVPVPTATDTADEPDETFSLVLSHATDSVISDAEGVGTIVDDDGPTLSVSDAWTTEGSEMQFTVKLSSKSPQQVTVAYATANGTATQPGDYLARSGTVTFAPGEASKTVAVQTVEDTGVEIEEEFYLNLSNPTQATIADGHAVGTIDDDGNRLSVNDPAPVTEGKSVSFTVSLSSPSAETVTVRYDTKDGTTKAPDDYTAKSSTLTFEPWAQTKTVSIPTTADMADEADETFSLVLSDPHHAVISDATGIATIVDDDGPELSVNDPSATEGHDVVFTVTLSSKSPQTVTVAYTTVDGTAVQPNDYTKEASTLTFAPGDTSEKVTVPTFDDPTAEGDEQFTLKLTSPTDATIKDGEGIGTINDNEGPSLRVADAPSALEGKDVTFVVTLSATSTETVTVHYATKDISASAPSDYLENHGTLTFAPGVTSNEVVVKTVDNPAGEQDESFSLGLSDSTHASIADGYGETWIDGNGTVARAKDIAGTDGDVGSDKVTEEGAIWMADHDVYGFTVWEHSTGSYDLSLTLRLSVPDNGGNLDLCLYDDTGKQIECQKSAGTADETITTTWPDQDGHTDTRSFFVEVVGGTPTAMNNYTLTLTR